MTTEDIKALNSCKVGESVTLSDGRRVRKQHHTREESCADCAIDNDCVCMSPLMVKCAKTNGIFVEVLDAESHN
jgi:hypothetical protein